MLTAFLLAVVAAASPVQAEQPVDPYPQSDQNAGATPFEDQGMWRAFHAQPGVDRIVEDFVRKNADDPVIGEIFKGQDLPRIRRLLKEQFCYILGGGCAYTGRAMKDVHKDLGLQVKDMNVLVVNLQKAMSDEHVPFFAQNRFLAKLAPMKRNIVVR